MHSAHKPMVVYMSSSFWLLAPESRDLSQVEKEMTACKAKLINKLTIIFTQNDNLGPFLSENSFQVVNLLSLVNNYFSLK